MLAYVFFHHPAQGVELRAYEEGLRRFHAALADEKPAGLMSSSTYRIEGAYSDWYLLEDSAALDPLNLAAVSGQAQAVHSVVANMATDFAGKLFTLVAGQLESHDFEIRFSKPVGTSYRDLYERLKPWIGRERVSLWRRMMVLGPAPEFCLLSPIDLALPFEMSPRTYSCDVV